MAKKLKTALTIIFQIIIGIFATAFVLVGTIFVYYYAKGYRIDLDDRNVRRTGVVNIESRPSRSDISINGENFGRSPKTIPSINEGIADVRITRDGYHDWAKKIPVLAEKSSPIIAELFKVKPTEEDKVILPAKSELVFSEKASIGDTFIYLTKDENSVFTIWRYNLNRNFWDLSNNPHVVSILEMKEAPSSFLLSPSGNNLIVRNDTETTSTEYTLYNTQLVDSRGQKIDLGRISIGYTVNWSKTENYLILESDSDIISYNITTQAKNLLYKKVKDEKLVWNTDNQSNFYFTQQYSDEGGQYMTIEKTNLDGSNPKTLIPRIYYKDSEDLITKIRGEKQNTIPFTNSPQGTNFLGKINNIFIDQTTRGIFISTDHATYWYLTSSDKYIIVTPYQSRVLSVSPDRKAILFEEIEGKKFGVFTFAKEVNNPITTLGTKIILEKSNEINSIRWISSNNLSYQEGNNINIIDKDGENKYQILTNESGINSFSFTNGGSFLHMIESEDENFKIVKYSTQ